MSWIQTFTGKKFFPLSPRAEDVDIRDVAHALSLTCRFTGHCREFYSVAQHSVLTVGVVRGRLLKNLKERPPDKRFLLSALLHDAAEAYMADIARPVKRQLAGVEEIEERLLKTVAERFGAYWPLPPAVKWADNVMLVTERRDLMAETAEDWGLREKPLRKRIEAWPPRRAEAEFLELFDVL